jgi:hypothetical protein
LEGICLRVQQAHHYLQVVFDPVMDLLEQAFFVHKQLLQASVLVVDFLLPGL